MAREASKDSRVTTARAKGAGAAVAEGRLRRTPDGQRAAGRREASLSNIGFARDPIGAVVPIFIGSTVPEGAASILKTSGMPYTHKTLESSPPNWARIVDHLGEAALVGAFARFTGDTLARLLSDQYAGVAAALAEALGKAPHLAMAHEFVLTSSQASL